MFSVLTEAHFIALYSHAESHPACCLHSGQVSDSVVRVVCAGLWPAGFTATAQESLLTVGRSSWRSGDQAITTACASGLLFSALNKFVSSVASVLKFQNHSISCFCSSVNFFLGAGRQARNSDKYKYVFKSPVIQLHDRGVSCVRILSDHQSSGLLQTWLPGRSGSLTLWVLTHSLPKAEPGIKYLSLNKNSFY